MDKYKVLLLAFGLTVSGGELVQAEEDTPFDERVEIKLKSSQGLSPLFLEVDQDEQKEIDDMNVGCSVSNSGC